MSKPLTPTELTFQSFHHSQGVISAQALMFRYFKITHDITADLHPSEPEVQRYIKYLGSAVCTGRHIDTVGGHTGPLNAAVRGIFKNIRDSDYKRPRRPLELSSAELLLAIGGELLSREAMILDPDKPWLSQQTGRSYGRIERVAERVRNGKTSFLYHYGRDQAPTTHPEFDGMYNAMWEHLSAAAMTDPEISVRFSRHAAVVERANAYHLAQADTPHEATLSRTG